MDRLFALMRQKLATFRPSPRERAGVALLALLVAGAGLTSGADWALSAGERASAAHA